MVEQMQEQMDEQRLADAAELERQIRETEDRLIDLRMRQAALLAGKLQPVQTVADQEEPSLAIGSYEDREPNAIYLDNGKDYDPSLIDDGVANSVESFLDAEDQAAAQDFATKPDPYETT